MANVSNSTEIMHFQGPSVSLSVGISLWKHVGFSYTQEWTIGWSLLFPVFSFIATLIGSTTMLRWAYDKVISLFCTKNATTASPTTPSEEEEVRCCQY